MKLTITSVLATVVVSASALEIQLSHLDGTRIRASVTNNDDKDYNLLSRGSVFDPEPVRKLDVRYGSTSAPFHGISKHSCAHGQLSQSDFTPLASQQTLEYDIDVADLYDLEAGPWNVSTNSIVPYANYNSTDLTGETLPLTSDSLLLKVEVTKKLELKRTTLQSDCSGTQESAVQAANVACAKFATAAAAAAESSDTALFETYFMTSDESTRSTVAANYRKVATECSTTPGGIGKSYCTDVRSSCGGTLLGYTYWANGASGAPSSATTYYCPRYFSVLDAGNGGCDDQSQASNTLHETTHAVLATSDITYGNANVKRLSASQALKNADTYAFYAISVNLGCGTSGTSSGSSGSSSSPSSSSSGSTGSAAGIASLFNSAAAGSNTGASASASTPAASSGSGSASQGTGATTGTGNTASTGGLSSWLSGLSGSGFSFR